MDVGDIEPNTNPFSQSTICPVNVHWHLGAEHYSVGEFDENGSGPHMSEETTKVQDGFRCHHYDAEDTKFTAPYDWKHCVDMELSTLASLCRGSLWCSQPVPITLL